MAEAGGLEHENVDSKNRFLTAWRQILLRILYVFFLKIKKKPLRD